MQTKRVRPVIGLLLALLLTSAAYRAQDTITTPLQQFGNNIGDDYFLANYTQLVEYWQKLAGESERMSMVEIGRSSEDRPITMAIITSPGNHRNLDRYKEISARLARAESLTDAEARALAEEGKAVVWIDGGLHASETLGSQQLIEQVYQLVSATDAETLRFLNDVIVLAVCANPDGVELVNDWYMRQSDPERRSTNNLPRLYNKYAGHDNNRDFYMSALSESEAINRILYREWYPQIVYNHHQTGPAGTVMFSPPFRDPFNHNYDPLIITSLEEVGAAMHSRFAMEGKPGVTTRSGATYSTWWNGGLRTSPYFHNQIGLLTETIGSPTPTQIPFIPDRLLARNDLPFPIPPQVWHFRQSIDYSITANRAVLDYASRNKDRLLFNIYRMGMNSIERGSRDSWTVRPRAIEALKNVIAQGPRGGEPAAGSTARPSYNSLRSPEARDPRGYILPADQPDFLTATRFVNILIKNGVDVHRAAGVFAVNGKSYPAGSYIVKSAQAFRPHVLDMFEPQDHPDDFAYPGAPPTPPYDSTGWTLALQMGVQFDRILDRFDGPFEKLPGETPPPAGRITQATQAAGYMLSHATNDSFVAVNRLLASQEDVYWIKNSFAANGKTYPAGTHFIPAKSTTLPKLQQMAAEIGLTFEAVGTRPSGPALMLRPLRIGLWDRYGGSMPSGWTRLVLEQFEFPFQVVYPRDLDAGDLAQKYDVLIFVDGGIPERDSGNGGADTQGIPAEYYDQLGSVSIATTVPYLRKFMDDGGAILAIGGSTILGIHTGLPIMDALTELQPNGEAADLPRTKFYVPGSIVQARVDNTNPLAFGFGDRVDFFFNNSPTFRLKPDAAARGVTPVAWFDTPAPLRSGWAWGQNFLQNGTAVVDATVGKGKLFLYGPEVVFRAQPHGTFKFLFNGIYYGRSEEVDLSQQ